MTVFTIAPRPAEGTKGTPVVVTTNCFRVSILRKLSFNHYHITIHALPDNREIKNIARRRDIVKKLYVQEHPNVFQPGQVVYDGKAGLYASKDLGPDRDLNFELRDPQSGGNGPIVRVTLQRVGFISDSDFENIGNQENVTDLGLTAQQILNLLLHNATPPDFRRVATRSTMFSMRDKDSIGMGLAFVRGCFASVRLARDHLLLNVDVCSAIMYDSNELMEVAVSLLDSSRRNYRELEDPTCLRKLLAFLKKVRVKQIRAGKVGRIRTVRELVPRAGFHTFYLEDGTRTTVEKYFWQVHNYRLRYPNLPGILVVKKDRYNKNTDKTDVIPFELLEVVEGQFYRRKLNERIQQEIHSHTTVSPDRRKQIIQNYLQAFNPTALNSAGLHVESNLVSVSGRLLPPPTIMLGNETKELEEGEWRLSRKRQNTFRKPCTIKRCAVLIYEPSCSVEFSQWIVLRLVENFRFFGLNVSELQKNMESVIIHKENSQGDIRRHLYDLTERLRRNEKKKQLEMDDVRHFLVLVILPGGGKSAIYEEIKRRGDTTAGHGLITQCLSWDKLQNMEDQRPSKVDTYLTNVVLKINAKMGGVNFVPVGQGLEWIYESENGETTMVIGLDVSHPGPGIFRPSMAGMVYSVDQFASRYFPICSLQPPRVEPIVNLEKMIKGALEAFSKEMNRTFGKWFLPDRLLIYRDGLSDGELANVCNTEIDAIQAGINGAWEKAPRSVRRVPADQVKITYVVVGKRHHIRFFPGKGQGDKSKNCPSGFVTDDKIITSPHVYDFFLQSHGGLLGTSCPAHYMVMRDDNSLTANELQGITFGLCHTLARATRAVSVPAPVYYAHLVCKRAAIHIRHRDDGSELSTTGSGDPEYNEEDWKFYPVNALQGKLMYYA